MSEREIWEAGVGPVTYEKRLERLLEPIHHKLDQILRAQGVVMADVSSLNAAIEALDADEVAAVDEMKALSEQVAQLTTERAPSQEEIDAITKKVTNVAEALKAGTPSKEAPAPAPAPEAPVPPAEPPAPAA